MGQQTNTKWIVIPNWDRFQHYKNRQPLWIKTYTELLNDPAYLGLTSTQRGALHGVWLMYAMSRGLLPLDLNLINGKLGLAIKMQTLSALNHAGFVHFAASKPLAIGYQAASPDREEEKEERREEPSVPPTVASYDGNGRTDTYTTAELEDLAASLLEDMPA